MVECSERLDSIFSSLADPTRRDILRRVAEEELSVSEIAEPYDLTIAAVSKHLIILEKAELIKKRRKGKQQFVHLAPGTIKEAEEYLQDYKKFWETRLDSLEEYLKMEAKRGKKKTKK